MMKNIGDIPRHEVTESELIEFANKLILWLTERDETGSSTDNFLYSEYCQKNNLFEDDIDYFINISLPFYKLMKRAEEIQKTKIKGFAASGLINQGIAKKLLSEKSKILRKEDEKVNKPKDLSKKQIAFCKEYVKDHNGKQAAIRAGYSEYTAENIASNLLRIVKVNSFISELEQKQSNEGEITKEKILREMSFLAFSNVQDYIDEYNQIVLIKDLPKEKAAAIKKIKTTKTEIIIEGEHMGDKIVTEVELYDKQRTHENISKLLGYEATKQMDINLSQPVIIQKNYD